MNRGYGFTMILFLDSKNLVASILLFIHSRIDEENQRFFINLLKGGKKRLSPLIDGIFIQKRKRIVQVFSN
ncbi:hypothetical protein ACWNXI_01905 [Caldibacillus thermoamylovorans]